MSEAPASPAPAGTAAGAGRKDNVLTHKIGPLPMWGWVAIAGGALVAWRLYSNKTSSSSTGSTAATGSSTDTSGNTVPQFVNQTYVTTTAPSAQDTSATTPAPVPTNPTNPSPVGSSTQPKPTTTLPGQWHYPAPTGLKTDYVAAKGVRLSWNGVTGPSGQHPNSYQVATYNSKGTLVSQHATISGNTSTDEYGPGGRGLAKGTYHTQVWAAGGPVAPPGATVQYTLKG